MSTGWMRAAGVVGLVLMAVTSQAQQALNVSAQYHHVRPDFKDYPYGDGDVSYMLAWETHNEDALIQFGASVCPTFEDNEAIDYAITPEMNLLLKDRVFRGGLGILSTYTKTDTEDKWMDMYWQFLLGMSFDVAKRLSLDGYAVYPFKDWGDLSEFRGGDVEYRAGLTWHF